MEALLIDEWVAGADDTLLVLDEASLTSVRDRVKAVGGASGVAADVVDRAVLVATELGRNQLRHAVAGRMLVRPLERAGHRGVEIAAVDRGTGLADPAAALDPSRAARSEGTLGVGIGSVRRLSTEVDFDVRLGEGTRVIARLFSDDAPRRREIGIFGHPIAEETISGDHAAFHRSNDVLLLVVCDGLGHGPPAREASHVAMGAVRAHAGESPADIIAASDRVLDATRGVVMAVCRLDESTGTVDVASVGNIELQVCSPRSARRFGGSSAVLGARGRGTMRARTETSKVVAGDVVVLTSDGISTKLTIEQDFALLREHPIVIAQRIMERFGRTNDDAIVLVAR